MSRNRRSRALLVAVAVLVVSALTLAPVGAAWAEDEEPVTHTVSGVFTTNLGTPFVEDYSAVNVWDHDNAYVTGVLLDPDGSYSLELPEGTYNFRFTAYVGEGVSQWERPMVQTVRRDVYVEEDMTLNAFDDEPSLTVRMQDPEGAPVAGYVGLFCTLHVDDWPVSGDNEDPLEQVRFMQSYAEGPGDLVVHGFDVAQNPEWGDGCQLIAYPDDGSMQYHEVDLSEDEPNEFTVTVAPAVTVSGHISTPRGVTHSANVHVTDSRGRLVGQPKAWVVDGDYEMRLTPGTYTFNFDAETDREIPDGDRERAVWRERAVVVDEDMTYDGTLDAVPVTVNIVDVNGDPATGAASADCREKPVPGEDGYSNLESTTWGTGQVTVWAMPNEAGEPGAWEYCRLGYQRVPEEGVDYNFAGNQVTIRADGPNAFTAVAPLGPMIRGGFHTNTDPDGVEDNVEGGAPSGDGNGDSVPDFQQDNVTSLPVNGESRGAGGKYVTLGAPEGSKLADVSTTSVSDLATPPPAGVTLPNGLTSFTLTDIAPGSTQTVSVWIWPRDEEVVDAWAKYDSDTGTWSVLPADRFFDAINRVDITLTDGGIGDDDGLVNGRITDPGGLALVATGDSTPPTVTGRATTRPNGAGWYKSNVRVDWSATDPSGVKTHPPDTTVTVEGNNVTAKSPLVCDKATPANCGRGSLAGLKIDKTAPSLAVRGVSNGATHELGDVPTPSCVASDALSGLAAPCRGVKTGGNSSGVGSFTYAATVADRAGNARLVSARYRVVYRFDGFAQPVNDPGPPVSVFKARSTVSVALVLKRANGTTVAPVSKPVWVSPVRGARTSAAVNEAVSNVKGTSGSTFVLRDGVWRFDWSTTGVAAGYLYRLGVRLDDGTTRYVTVGVR